MPHWLTYSAAHGLSREPGLPPEGHAWLDVRGEPSELDGSLYHQLALDEERLNRLRQRPRSLAALGRRAYFVLEYLPPEGSASSLEVLVERNLLLTIHQAEMPMLADIRQRLADGELFRRGIGYALLELLEGFTRSYQESLDGLLQGVERLNEQLLRARYQNLPQRMFHIKRQSLRLRQAMEPALDAFHLLKQQDFTGLGDDGLTAFGDNDYHLRHLYQTVDGLRESLNSTVQAYSSIQSNRTNEVMRLLTLVSVLFLPPTLVASIYGMNFKIPEYHWPWGYYYALILMAALAGGLLYYVRRRE